MLLCALALMLAYLIGSISGSLVLGRLVGVDIRTRGSGNAGGTNALRTLGWKFAIAVVAIDIGKGALAAWLGLTLAAPPVSPLALGFAAAMAAAVGHTWPMYFGFRGGKGAGTLIGGLLLLWPSSVLPLLTVWLGVLTLTGYVGLATICTGIALLAVALWQGALAPNDPRLLFAFAVAAFLLFTHRVNVARLVAGKEHRFERAQIWKRLLARGRE